MNVDAFVIQEFVTKRRQLVPTSPVKARTRQHALASATELARRAEGVAVLHVVADDETGEVSHVNILARHGAIPDDFEDQVRG